MQFRILARLLIKLSFTHYFWTNAVLTKQQTNFNYRLSRARIVTEGAYGQMKGRWRVLLWKIESEPDQVKTTALACIVLHNICIEKGETLSKKLDPAVDPVTNERRDRVLFERYSKCDPVKKSKILLLKPNGFEMCCAKHFGKR